MALINYEIEPRSYELIRDRVGLILADELQNQAAMTYEDLFLADVYVQRSKPIQPEECPMINIAIDSGSFDNQTIVDSDTTVNIFVDIFTTGSYDGNNRGDVLSSFDAQKLAGVCVAILSHPLYVTLGFERPFIMRSKVTNFEPGTIERGESTNLSVVRLTLGVKSGQNEPSQEAITEFQSQTSVLLAETDLGYLYQSNNL